MVKNGGTRFIQLCIQWSSIALLWFDYFLTFGMEARYIWRQKFRFSTVLYICCRYALIANIVYLLGITGHLKDVNCHTGYWITGILGVLGRAAVVIVWGIRTYAVFGRNILVGIFFGVLGLFVVVLDIIGVPTAECSGASSIPIAGGLLAIMMVVFEILSVGFTTIRAVQALSVGGGSWRSSKKGFTYLILEQGILYFCVVSGLTVATLALNIRLPGGFFQRLLNAYTGPMSGLMTARFILHLRKWEAKHAAFRSGSRQPDGDDFQHDTQLDFGGQTTGEVHRSTIHSVVSIHEFGEDPVRRARERGPLDYSHWEEGPPSTNSDRTSLS